MKLHNLPKRKKRKEKRKRVGRGMGSGVGGHVVGRGMKGQLSRSGHKSMLLFEGGNVPFYRKVPKAKGFKKVDKVEYQPINLYTLQEEFKSGDKVNIEALRDKGLVRKRTKYVKILGGGEIKKKLTIEGLAMSKSARKKIEEANGTIKE
jgi:large subunit ribosomal protein L15